MQVHQSARNSLLTKTRHCGAMGLGDVAGNGSWRAHVSELKRLASGHLVCRSQAWLRSEEGLCRTPRGLAWHYCIRSARFCNLLSCGQKWLAALTPFFKES